MAQIYTKFSKILRTPTDDSYLVNIWDTYDSYRDYSEEALLEAFERESYGKNFSIVRDNGKINGYIEGKQWMDLTITEYWKPDLEIRELFIGELLEQYSKEFLTKILPKHFPT